MKGRTYEAKRPKGSRQVKKNTQRGKIQVLNSKLQVSPQHLNLIQEEGHFLLGNLRREDHHAEEVDPPFLRLIANHHAPLPHHALLYDWRHLVKTTCYYKNFTGF